MSYPELAERLRKAFKKKTKWFKTQCPRCDKKVEYQPGKNWDGRLRCGECGHVFTLLILDHFMIEYRDEAE